MREQSKTTGDGWRIPPPSPERFGVTDEADLRWVGPKVGDQPRLTFEQPLHCASAVGAALWRTYIYCTGFGQSAFGPFAERARTDASWRYRELDTGHDAMITAPGELVDLLRDITRQPVV